VTIKQAQPCRVHLLTVPASTPDPTNISASTGRSDRIFRRPATPPENLWGSGVVGASWIAAGVQGWGYGGPGVYGLGTYHHGVLGISPNQTGVAGVSTKGSGVHGQSENAVGVYGWSRNGIGVLGSTINPAKYAGLFRGQVRVEGTLTANAKNSVVPFPDGTQRVLHCMESPEHWFEDFGAAKLKNGRAVVKLDADFAKLIKRGHYRVFVTPEGDCGGLYVRRKSASFEVREFRAGKSSVAFSYRIVGRRKDIKQHRRFAKAPRLRVPLPTAEVRRQRRPAPTPARLRELIARMREAAERRPTGAETGRRPRALRKRARIARWSNQ
jgi:hypothetical protein